jgi:hypothetical protein
MIPSACVWDPRPDAESPGSELRPYERVFGHAYTLAAAAVFVVVLTSAYVKQESVFYFWDYAVFQNLATRTALAFQRSFADGYVAVGRSLVEDYNAIFAVPLVPLFRALGTTRLAYELGIALVYGLPFALAVGTIGVALIRGARAAVFWSTVAIALLTPMTWIPGFRGYPDVGAALLVTLAIRVCLGDPGLHRPRSIVAIGVLLAGAILYRRHFLFAASALLATAGIMALVEGRIRSGGRPRPWARHLLGTGFRILLVVTVGALTAFAVARPAALRLLGHDFYGLYTAYLNPTTLVAAWFVQPYGWLALAGALLGFLLGLRAGVLEPLRTLWLVVFAAIGALQWALIVRQVGEQYTLHFTPTILVGLAALGWTIRTRTRGATRATLLSGAGIYLAANLLFGIAGTYEFVRLPLPGRSLLAANWPPLIREDHAQLALLVEALRKQTKPEDPVFVAASSTTLNPDLLANAERSIYGWDSTVLNVENTPAIDSRDYYPMEALLQAQVLVLADPLQTHLPADQQKVLGVVHEMFTAGVEIARDFEQLTPRFALQDGAEIVLFRRRRPTSLETGLGTLRYIQQRFPTPPGAQADWVVVSSRFPSWVTRRADGATTLTWHPALPGEVPAPVAVYLGNAPEKAQATGAFRFLNRGCSGAAAAFSLLAADGSIRDAAELARRPEEAEEFEVPFDVPPPSRLLLRLRPRPGQESIDYCLLTIDSLVVRTRP